MYQTILVPLDGSKRAEAIIPHVEEMAQCSGVRAIFLQVVFPTFAPPEPYGMIPEVAFEEIRRVTDEARRYLSGWQGEFREKGIETKVCVEHAAAIVQTILDVADREEADLIAMASHGRTGLARVFYGSVAAGVLHQTARPLLLVRAQDAGSSALTGHADTDSELDSGTIR